MRAVAACLLVGGRMLVQPVGLYLIRGANIGCRLGHICGGDGQPGGPGAIAGARVTTVAADVIDGIYPNQYRDPERRGEGAQLRRHARLALGG
jgi:hypothetical protein